MDPFEPTPEEQQAALIEALRQRQQQPQAADFYRGWGNLMQQAGRGSTGDFGRSQVQQAQQMDRGDGSLLLKLMGRGGTGKTREELDNLSATATLKRAKAAQLGKPKDTSFKDATDLRKELSGLPETKDISQAESIYAQIPNAPPTGAGDLSLIYGLAKMFDPSGRVTDSDAEMALKTGGVPGKYAGYYNQLLATGTLSDAARKDIKQEAARLMEGRRGAYAPIREKFTGLSKKRGLDPGDVVIRPPTAGGGFSLDDKDQKAIEWSKKNPDSPKAQQIIKLFGGAQ